MSPLFAPVERLRAALEQEQGELGRAEYAHRERAGAGAAGDVYLLSLGLAGVQTCL